jgi:hypothetical protein
MNERSAILCSGHVSVFRTTAPHSMTRVRCRFLVYLDEARLAVSVAVLIGVTSSTR